MTKRHAIWTAIAAVHLILVLCGAIKLPLLSQKDLGGKMLAAYTAMSGADCNYGFFAPNVGVQTRATFTLVDGTGRTWTDELNRGDTDEANFRFNDTPGAVSNLGDLLAGSLAATMFGRHPDARLVVVTFEIYNPPTMANFRDGARAEWEPVYRSMFVRNQPVSSN